MNQKNNIHIFVLSFNDIVSDSTMKSVSQYSNSIIKLNENSSIQSIVSDAIKSCDKKYAMILLNGSILKRSFDDMFKKYENSNFDVLLPLSEIIHEEKVCAFYNEFFWNYVSILKTSDENRQHENTRELDGRVYFEAMNEKYERFDIDGCLFNVGTFLGLKDTIKHNFEYEYILRALHQKQNVFISHVFSHQKDIAFNILDDIEDMTAVEKLHWVSLARTQCHHNTNEIHENSETDQTEKQ